MINISYCERKNKIYSKPFPNSIQLPSERRIKYTIALIWFPGDTDRARQLRDYQTSTFLRALNDYAPIKPPCLALYDFRHNLGGKFSND